MQYIITFVLSITLLLILHDISYSSHALLSSISILSEQTFLITLPHQLFLRIKNFHFDWIFIHPISYNIRIWMNIKNCTASSIKFLSSAISVGTILDSESFRHINNFILARLAGLSLFVSGQVAQPMFSSYLAGLGY